MEKAWRTVLTLLVLFAAPLVAGWRALVERSPGVALLVAAAWLGVVAAGWLFWRIASQSVDQHLGEWATAFDRLVRRRLSRYGKVYAQWVMDSRRFLDAKGLATVGMFSPEMDEVFVDVGLAARAPRQVHPGLVGPAPADDAQRRSIRDFLDHEQPVVLAVIGAPGSGKTTLLNHVARVTARSVHERRRGIPVVLQLRDHAATVAAEPGISLAELVRRALPTLTESEPAGWWDHQLARGRCVVLLDGLDEVANADQRRDIVAWVNERIALHPRNDFVVTSRPHGYRDAYVASATTLQILSFTPDQVRQFLHTWYRAVEERATGTTGRDVEMLAREAADDLLDRLATAPALYDLTINPLLLTMIANVHRFRRSLPNSRADLYGEVCEVMLWRRQEAKRMELDLPGISKQRILAWLAFEMMRKGTRDVTRRVLLDGVRPRLQRVSATITPEEFVNDIGSNGLLVERERDQYEFAHLTFQEYLAARYIQEHGLEQVLVTAVDDPWWRETTLLYLAGADADPIVEAALRSGTPTALSLAFECDEIGAELAPELRERLTGVLREAFAPQASPESRRLVAGVLASRHRRLLVPAGQDGTRVCPEAVGADLYWLFRQDTGTPAPDAGTPRSSAAPARGMWSSDAVAFVRWINRVAGVGGPVPQGTGVLYRLPTAAELDALATGGGPASQLLSNTVRRAWHTGGRDEPPSVWCAPGVEPANVVTPGVLLAALVADLRGSGLLPRLLTLTAVGAAGRLDPAGRPIRDAAREIARGMASLRSGQDAAGLENSPALEDLRGHLARARRETTKIDRALQHLQSIHGDDAAVVGRVLGRFPIDEVVHSLTRAASLGRDVAIAQDWNRDLGVDQVLPVAITIQRQVHRARQQYGDKSHSQPGPPASLLERCLAVDKDRHPQVTGDALGKVVTDMLKPRPVGDEKDDATLFVTALLRLATGGDPEPATVDLGRLTGRLQVILDPVGRRSSAPEWANSVLHGLRAAAVPMLERRATLTAETATRVRLPALVLAAEAVAGGRREMAADLRHLAAATCLIQRRTRGTDVLETLVLATA
ncbi:NACHT domain-containing protein [Winogradskya humida]|uniref:NACHT domain-containing protein n=1 Tax=Winogradskya humida TaxID=113566 RepID=A0ABQ3ZUD7_9ACTN|nr:NACHT domain-containing protein [Actinoplanes humidus]GIE22169.1 hypothetical protein Ahu01nite_052710 [Actinoplanes humidus]